MHIIDASRGQYPDSAVRVFSENAAVPFSVAAEHWMDVFVNERLAMRVVCTPEHLDELVVGRLLTEGLIRHPEDIEAIYICERGLRARVVIRKEAMEQLTPLDGTTAETCCTDNRILMRNRLREMAFHKRCKLCR